MDHNKKLKIYNLLLLFGVLLGAFASLYLWSKELSGVSTICNTGCDVVLKSEYSKLLGITLSAYGVAFYVVLGGLLFQKMNIKHLLIDKMFGLVLGFGLIFSLYLRYLEFFKIGDICRWCWGSFIAIVFMCVVFLHERMYVKRYGSDN